MSLSLPGEGDDERAVHADESSIRQRWVVSQHQGLSPSEPTHCRTRFREGGHVRTPECYQRL